MIFGPERINPAKNGKLLKKNPAKSGNCKIM